MGLNPNIDLTYRTIRRTNSRFVAVDIKQHLHSSAEVHHRILSKKDVCIRPMEPVDIPRSLAIFGEELGQGYVSIGDLAKFVNTETGVALIAEFDNNIVAAATGEILTNAGFVNETPSDMRTQIRTMIPHSGFGKIGLLKSISVSKDCRSAGIGSELTERVVRNLWDRDAAYIVTIGWTTGVGCHIEGVVKRLGFCESGILNNFWAQDSVVKNYDCPWCGQPCHCQAKVFVLSGEE